MSFDISSRLTTLLTHGFPPTSDALLLAPVPALAAAPLLVGGAVVARPLARCPLRAAVAPAPTPLTRRIDQLDKVLDQLAGRHLAGAVALAA